VAEGIDVETAGQESNRKAMTKAKNRYLAMAMVSAADLTRYSRLLEDLDNDYTEGGDNYPRMITDAYNLTTGWQDR
jgi:hypothetical protein